MLVSGKALVCFDSTEFVLRETDFFESSGKDDCGNVGSSGVDIFANLFERGLSSLRRGFFSAVGALLFRVEAVDCRFRFWER